jgi:HEAT repeat protein
LSLAAASATPVLTKQHSYWRTFGDTYLHLLVRSETTAASGAFLRAITREDPAALRAAISALPHQPDPAWLFLLERGLTSGDTATTSAALAVLQSWELEASVLRLLPLLEHHDVAIQCQTAELFRHWFHEEEAVIQRKWLALTPLVRLLDDSASEAQICAMAALAEAEHFRGFHRLVQLTGDINPAVALAAVQTLGRIRQREAIPVLQSLAAANTADPAMGPAIEYALALLAAPGTNPTTGAYQATPAVTRPAPPGPDVQALLVLYRSNERSAERQLLAQLDTLATAAAWQDFLSRLPANNTRTQRVLMKGVFHRDAAIQRLAIDNSEPLLLDPGLSATLWRRVESPGLQREVQLALIDKLGQHDANRMLLLLDRIEPSP